MKNCYKSGGRATGKPVVYFSNLSKKYSFTGGIFRGKIETENFRENVDEESTCAECIRERDRRQKEYFCFRAESTFAGASGKTTSE